MKKQPDKELNWDIKVQPITTITGIVTNTKAILRNDNNAVLGYVSDRYKPLPNRELIKLCHTIERTGQFRTQGYECFRGGKLVMAFIRNYAPGLKLNGLDMDEYFVIGNSHDGSKKLFVGTAHSLIRCENQFSSVTPLFKVVHRGKFDFKEEFISQLKQQYESGRKLLYSKLECLERKKVNSELINRMIIYLLNTDRMLPGNEMQQELLHSQQGVLLNQSIARETKELGMNAFGLINVITWYTTHEIRNTRQHFGNTSGISKRLNEKAFHFCTEMIP
jgi:hypothetical protein